MKVAMLDCGSCKKAGRVFRKPFYHFTRHSKSARGRCSKCKSCVRAEVSAKQQAIIAEGIRAREAAGIAVTVPYTVLHFGRVPR